MTTPTRLAAAGTPDLDHETVSVTGAQSSRRAFRAFPLRKAAFSPSDLQSSNSADPSSRLVHLCRKRSAHLEQ
jgi:hypothetical protein